VQLATSMQPWVVQVHVGGAICVASCALSTSLADTYHPSLLDGCVQGEDAFHFIAYLPVSGTLYELDGLKQGPIALAQGVSGEVGDWVDG
jgi:hypothetical protein